MAAPAFNVLSLCTGYGGLDLALRGVVPNARTVCYVERELYPAAILAARMQDGALDSAPIWSDLRSFDGRPWRGLVDCICGGYPCQPFSLAGKRQGTRDPRFIWPHIWRIIREVDPAICFFENVPGHLTLGLERVYAGLSYLGYRLAPPILVTAEEIGAGHRRERLFLLAYASSIPRGAKPQLSYRQWADQLGRSGKDLADTHRIRRELLGSGSLFNCERATSRHDPDGCDRKIGILGHPPRLGTGRVGGGKQR